MKTNNIMYLVISADYWDTASKKGYIPLPDDGLLQLYYDESVLKNETESHAVNEKIIMVDGQSLQKDVIWQPGLYGESAPYATRPIALHEVKEVVDREAFARRENGQEAA